MSAAAGETARVDGGVDGAPAAVPSASWCALPWVHLFAGEVGTLRPCCMALEEPDMVNRDADGNPHVIYAPEGIEAAWNSGFMRDLRGDMLAGRRPAACQRCFREEDLGISSHRIYSNETFADHVAGALENTAEDGAVPIDMIRSMDIRLGNKCNLKCRMCSPVSSRALRDEYAALYDIDRDDDRLLALIGPDWVSSPHFHDTFARCAAGAEKLLFAGGEPLLVPEMAKLLRGLIDRGLADGIDLQYVTNLTVLPEALFPIWAQFRSVGFVVSMDGVGKVGELIRHPLNWARFDRNARALDARALSMNCAGLHTNITVQAYNALQLDDIVSYAATALPHFGRPKLSLLFYPEHLTVRVLSPELKAIATDRLRRLADRVRAGWPEQWVGEGAADLLSMIDGVIDFMNGADRSDLLPEFQRWTHLLDGTRGESTAAAIPEIAAILG